MQKRGGAVRGGIVLLLIVGLCGAWFGPDAGAVRAADPTIAVLPVPVGPSAGLTGPRLAGSSLVWQDTGGVFGVNLVTGKPLPIPAAGATQPDIAGTYLAYRQGATGVATLDLTTGTAANIAVGDARSVDGVAVSETGVVAWRAQDAGGVVVKAWDRGTGTVTEAGRIPAERLTGENLGVPRASGRRVVFANLTADITHLSRFIVYNLDDGSRTAINDAFGGVPVYDFRAGRLAVVQSTRISVFDLNTNAVEAFSVLAPQGQPVTSITTDGATVMYSTGTAVYGYDLARKTGFTVAMGRANISGLTVSGATVVWSENGTLIGRVVAFGDTAPPVVVRTDYQYFPQTGYIVGYTFLRYWIGNGGAPIFGYPLTNDTVDPATKLVVQYFERSRFESHPENAGRGDVVQLTNVGRIVTAARTDPAFAPQPLVPQGMDRTYFVQTQHALQGAIKTYFERNGGVAIFGYPISEETIEPSPTDGLVYTVQYFERARFELHPEITDSPNGIQLGQLGRQILQGQLGLYRPECTPQYIQKPILPECK